MFQVDGRWLFRFPKRQDVEPSLELEIRMLPRIASYLAAVEIPRYRFHGQPSPLFPYRISSQAAGPGASW